MSKKQKYCEICIRQHNVTSQSISFFITMEPNKLEKVTNELNTSVQTYPNILNEVTGNVV